MKAAIHGFGITASHATSDRRRITTMSSRWPVESISSGHPMTTSMPETFSAVVWKCSMSTQGLFLPTPGLRPLTRQTLYSLRHGIRSQLMQPQPPSGFAAISPEAVATTSTRSSARTYSDVSCLKDSYHHAEHPVVAALCLHGPFIQIPEWLYFRRDHPQQAERACTTMRSRCANMDPRRADPIRHPKARLYAEYLWGYVRAIRRAPLTSAERSECYKYLALWLAACEEGTASKRASTSLQGFRPI